MTAVSMAQRPPVHLSRDSATFRLTFTYRKWLVDHVKEALPCARFDAQARAWFAPVSVQAMTGLNEMYTAGLLDCEPATLLAPDEVLPSLRPASLQRGTAKRPFAVTIAVRSKGTYELLRAIGGATWDKARQAISFPGHASSALADLVSREILDDPEGLLSPASTVIAFDPRTGQFSVRGEEGARAAFTKHFPAKDPYSLWRERGLDVAFADPFTEEVYRGELARVGPLLDFPEIAADLYEFQRRNAAVALERTGYAIVDEPGLGKTIQAITVGARLLALGDVRRVCVLVPGTVRTQWAEEIHRFTGTERSEIVTVRGTPAQRAKAYEAAASAQWFIVHYDVLSKDLDALRPLFDDALVVADEAHRLKSYNSARTTAALALSQSAARRLALSGTPLEANVSEWYQVMSGFAVPGTLGTASDFNSRYRYATAHGHEGARNLVELRERTQVHYGRHTKAQVASHLPPLRVQQLILDPDAQYAKALRVAHRTAADEIAKHSSAQYGTSTAQAADTADRGRPEEMSAVGQLRMLCSSPQLLLRSESNAAAALTAAGLVPDIDGPKLDELRVMAADFRALRDVRQMANHPSPPTPEDVQLERFIVFTFSRSMANLIAERFAADGIPYVLYTGDVSAADRDAAVARFTDPTSEVIAFIATDAAAEGLNLGKCCSTLIQFDPPWTPSRAQQRVNRIHRLDGTASQYQVINLVVANTLEIGIYRLLGERADLQDTLFGETQSRYKVTGKHSRTADIFDEAMADFVLAGKQSTEGYRQARTPAPSSTAGGEPPMAASAHSGEQLTPMQPSLFS